MFFPKRRRTIFSGRVGVCHTLQIRSLHHPLEFVDALCCETGEALGIK